MRYVIEYGLYEDQSREFNRECSSLEEVYTFLSVMEGLMSYYHIYDEDGDEIELELYIENNLGLPGVKVNLLPKMKEPEMSREFIEAFNKYISTLQEGETKIISLIPLN